MNANFEVWSICFLTNVFTALKGTHFCIFINHTGKTPWNLLICLLETLHWLGLTHCWRNLTLGLQHAGKKPCTDTCSCWWQTLHYDLHMVVTNLKLTLSHYGNKPYTETCSCWWQTLPWLLFMLVTNVTGDKPYTDNCSWCRATYLTLILINSDEKLTLRHSQLTMLIKCV